MLQSQKIECLVLSKYLHSDPLPRFKNFVCCRAKVALTLDLSVTSFNTHSLFCSHFPFFRSLCSFPAPRFSYHGLIFMGFCKQIA